MVSKEMNEFYMGLAAKQAENSQCIRSKCGSIIVAINENGSGEVLGYGFNDKPCGDKTIGCLKDSLPSHFKSDKTCCVHAEQRAIMDALKSNPHKLKDSILYFVRLKDDNSMGFSGKPYCTICSKMALDAGIKYFALYHKEGIKLYDTLEYNKLSFEHAND